jgi:AcrR family transcriptional regulator
MGARRDDRRVHRTEQLLRTALVSLIEEKGFETLTVQDIIDRANVGRATFYAHFDNKEDLLVSGFDGLRTALKELQRQAHLRTTSWTNGCLHSVTRCLRISQSIERCFGPWWVNVAAPWSSNYCKRSWWISCEMILRLWWGDAMTVRRLRRRLSSSLREASSA